MTVSIEADLSGAIRANQAMLDRLGDLTPPLKVGAEALATAIDDRFRTSTDFRGEPFAPNAPSTIAKKGSSKPDIDTGILRRSIVVRVDGKDTIRFGTNTPYAAPVFFGSHRGGTLQRMQRAPRLGEGAHGPRHEKPAGTTWSVETPGRNVLPVDEAGMWIDAGAAKALLEKIANLVGRWVATGSLT